MRQLTNDFCIFLTAKVETHFLSIFWHVKRNIGFVVILILILQSLLQPAHLICLAMDQYNVRGFDCTDEFCVFWKIILR